MEEEGIALSNTIFSEHWPKDTKALGARLSRMLSSFLRPLPRPLISSRDASWRYAPLRYASLRYASMRYAYLRYASLRYAYLRYAFSRYAYLCYAFYHSVCLSSFWLDAWYLKRVFALQLRLDAFPICSIELVLWTDACTIWIIWYQFLLIEFLHSFALNGFYIFQESRPDTRSQGLFPGKRRWERGCFNTYKHWEIWGEIFRFTNLLLDSRKMSFKPGDLIWAKIRGFRHWPARVSSIYFEIKADESEGLLSWCWSWVETRSTLGLRPS